MFRVVHQHVDPGERLRIRLLLEQHPERRDEDVRGHFGGGGDEADEVAVVVVVLSVKLGRRNSRVVWQQNSKSREQP